MLHKALVLLAIIVAPVAVLAHPAIEYDGLIFIFQPGDQDARANWQGSVTDPDGVVQTTGDTPLYSPGGVSVPAVFEHGHKGVYKVEFSNSGPTSSRLGSCLVIELINNKHTVVAPDKPIKDGESFVISYDYTADKEYCAPIEKPKPKPKKRRQPRRGLS